ncbi:MAG: hypothetical protein ACM31C_03165 [Acidobacteriota bacterium]
MLLVLAILALLAVLAARARAAPLAAAAGSDREPTGDDTHEPDDRELDPGPDVPPPSQAGARVTSDELAAARAGMPTSGEVVAAAYRAAGLASDPAPAWRRRARLAGLVPTLNVRGGRDTAWRDVSDPTIAYVSVFSAGATWHLERLMFDPNELRISAIEAGRRRDRRRVAALAIRSYFAWLHARAAALRDARWAGHADEAAAELDALTDGWFSQAASRNLPAGTRAHQARAE